MLPAPIRFSDNRLTVPYFDSVKTRSASLETANPGSVTTV